MSTAMNQNPAGQLLKRCSDCHTTVTPTWRRDKSGNLVCNACGVYERKMGVKRPPHLYNRDIIPRKRKTDTNVNQNTGGAKETLRSVLQKILNGR